MPELAQALDGRSRKQLQPEDYAALAALLPAERDRPVFASLEDLIALDPALLAEAVRAVWPDARILVTTRAPADYLRSSWTNSSLKNTFTAEVFARRFSAGHMRLSHDLDRTAQIWREALGPDAVTFLPYEMLRDDPEAFLRRMEALIGVPLREDMPDLRLNASPPVHFLALMRALNLRLAAEAPQVFGWEEWRVFRKAASFAGGLAPGLDQHLADSMRRKGTLDDLLPRLPPEASEALAARMTVLRDLPDYVRYLALYGLAREEGST